GFFDDAPSLPFCRFERLLPHFLLLGGKSGEFLLIVLTETFGLFLCSFCFLERQGDPLTALSERIPYRRNYIAIQDESKNKEVYNRENQFRYGRNMFPVPLSVPSMPLFYCPENRGQEKKKPGSGKTDHFS